MGHRRTRPIVGETAAGVGITYIVVDQGCDDTNVQVTAEGTVTFTVDWTNENILYDATAIAAVNIANDADRYVAPGDATWVALITTGSADANAALTTPVFAIRVNITAGTGTVKYHINQA
jgi:archaellum component FlaF (FlaF/FlaG flagellin family)